MKRGERDQRRYELSRIHMGADSLGLDRDAYEALLFAATGKRSATGMTETERRQVLNRMRQCGASFGVRKRVGVKRETPAKDSGRGTDRQIAKIRAMLIRDARPDSYAMGILRNAYGAGAPGRLEWATGDQCRHVIAALRRDKKRRSSR